MADQNNDNSNRPMNSEPTSIADVGRDLDTKFELAEAERISKRWAKPTERFLRLETKQSDIEKLIRAGQEEARQNPAFASNPLTMSSMKEYYDRISDIEKQKDQLRAFANTKAESEISSIFHKSFAPEKTSVAVREFKKHSDVQNQAFGFIGQPDLQLRREMENLQAEFSKVHNATLNDISGMRDPKTGEILESPKFNVHLDSATNIRKKMAVIETAQDIRRLQGIDDRSSLTNIAKMAKRAQNQFESEADRVQRTGVSILSESDDPSRDRQSTISAKDLQKEQINQLNILNDAFKNLSSTVTKSEEELDGFRKKAERAATNIDTIDKALDTIKDNRIQRYSQLSMLASTASSGFNIFGNAAQTLLVDQRLQQVGNIAGWANIANDQYDAYVKARRGDVMARRQLTRYTEANKFGEELVEGTNVVRAAQAFGTGAQMAAGTFKLFAGLESLLPGLFTGGAGASATTAVSGGIDMAAAAAAGATQYGDYSRKISTQAAKITGINTDIGTFKALNSISAQQEQTLQNYYMGLDVPAQGMGLGRSAGFIKNSMSADTVKKISRARLSPEQYTKYAEMGEQLMGGMFDISGDQIFRAAELQRVGLGSIGQNLTRQGALAMAGTQNPSKGLEAIMSAAMTKGLNDSKAIDALVQNTASMVQSTSAAALGIDTTKTVAGMITGGINTDVARKNGFAAIQDSISAAQLSRAITTDRSVTWTGTTNVAGIQSRTGLDTTSSFILQNLESQDLKAALSSRNDAEKLLEEKGVNLEGKDATTVIKQVLQEKATQLFKSGLLSTKDANRQEDILAIFEKEVERAEKEKRETSTYNINRDLKAAGLDVSFMQSSQLDERGKFSGGTAKILQGLSILDPRVGSGDLIDTNKISNVKTQMNDLSKSGDKQITEAMQSAMQTAAKTLGGFENVMKSFVSWQQALEKDGVGKEDKFAQSATELATSFGGATGVFNTAVNNFDSLVKQQVQLMNAIAEKAGLYSKGTTDSKSIKAIENLINESQANLGKFESGKGNTAGKSIPGVSPQSYFGGPKY